jgi:hypothetical protein
MDDEMESVADLLPELSEEDKEIAVSQESISWVWGLLGRYRPGDIHNTGYGVLLQKVTFDTARCIRVYNHPEPLYMLNAFLSQFQHASAVLEIGSCTVLTPVPKVELEEPESNEESMSREKKVVEISTVNKEATKKSDYNFGMEVA